MKRTALIVFTLFLSLSSWSQAEWQTLNASSQSWRFEDLFFVNEEVGWAVDGAGLILKTSNGGQSWTQQMSAPNLYFRSVEFINEDIGFVATLGGSGSNAQLFKTLDGGDTWNEITNLPQTVVGICGMSAPDENTIYLTGTFWTGAFVMKSEDQGNSWTYTSLGNMANGLVDIDFISADRGLVVGQSAQGTGLRAIILGTEDGGDTWQVRSTGSAVNQRAWKIQYLTEEIVYVSIEEFEPSPQYFKSSDGGVNWDLMTVQTSNTSGTMQGIGFLNEQLGWIGGWGELFYETSDGGLTWDYMPIGGSVNRFFKVSDTKMFTSGLNVYCYEDPDLVGLSEVFAPEPAGHNIQLLDGQIQVELVNHTYCELSIYDQSGRKVKDLYRGRRDAGLHHFDWDSSSLSSGWYSIVLYSYHGYDAIPILID